MSQAANALQESNLDAALSGDLDDLVLIEEHIDSGLLELLNSYEPVESLAKLPLDVLDDRFEIDVSAPLTQYDTLGAKAYRAKDRSLVGRKMIALVCSPRLPQQQSAMDALCGLQHPNMMILREYGRVRLSHNNEIQTVMFMDEPQGKPISQLITQLRGLHERQIIDLILAPLIDALASMQERGVSHGSINTHNVYFGEQAILGECLSEPHGITQNDFYEPVERLIAEPLTRGAATPKSDAYALGMLAFDIMFGLERFRGHKRDEIIRALLEKGAYHCYVAHKEFSDMFADFFRGCLSDHKTERWGIDQLRAWVGGKRFNLILPSIPKEATRPLEFSEKDYFNCRALANAVFSNWPTANKQIRASKLDRWLEMSAHQSDKADMVSRIMRNYGDEIGGTDRVNNEMLSRLIIALDPTGPMRYRSLAVNVDGIGLSMNAYFKERDHNKMRMLSEVIDMDLPTYWSEVSEGEKTPQTGNTLWILQRIRSYMGWKHYGFGMERIVYDLNPNLPCQCDWLQGYSVSNVAETLNAMDNLAKTHAEDTSLASRELTAFLASKIEMSKEVKFNQLGKVPKLRDHPELLAMRIISLAQDKIGKKKMVGLATWAAIRADKLLENIHSRKLRRKIRDSLRLAAKTGVVSRVLAVIVENDMTKDDHMGFSRANTVYLRNSVRIEALQNGSTLKDMAKDFGGRISVFIAYTILCITFYAVLENYYF